jgi:hypothetical protein
LRHERSEAIEKDINIKTKSDVTFASLLDVLKRWTRHRLSHRNALGQQAPYSLPDFIISQVSDDRSVFRN